MCGEFQLSESEEEEDLAMPHGSEEEADLPHGSEEEANLPNGSEEEADLAMQGIRRVTFNPTCAVLFFHTEHHCECGDHCKSFPEKLDGKFRVDGGWGRRCDTKQGKRVGDLKKFHSEDREIRN